MRAYPRMRGGTGKSFHGMVLSRGLSPHARGNLYTSVSKVTLKGPIPACAGEPSTRW